MTTRRRPPRRAGKPLALTVALAMALGAIVYLSVTSLPYLAASPTTDPAFGALNACLLEAVPQRLGFVVSADATRAAAWSPGHVAECAGTPPAPTRFEVPGVTLAAYDREGALWLAGPPRDGGAPVLRRLEGGLLVEKGALTATALAGTARGVLALDAAGQLVSVSTAGDVLATRALPGPRAVTLAVSADGQLASLVGDGRFAVVRVDTLEQTPTRASCPVLRAWWRPGTARVVVECEDLALDLDALGSEGTLVDATRRVPSVLLGPAGLYVQACDQLPCSAEPPR